MKTNNDELAHYRAIVKEVIRLRKKKPFKVIQISDICVIKYVKSEKFGVLELVDTINNL